MSRHSLHSFSREDSQYLSSKDDYWYQKVDKMMQYKRQVNNLIKQKNQEIRSSKQENLKLEQALKQKDSLIEKLKLEQMLKRQRPANKLSSFHFHEVSDIISEEDSPQQQDLSNPRRKHERRESSENPSVTSPLIQPSPERQFSFKELKQQCAAENLRESASPALGQNNRSLLPSHSDNQLFVIKRGGGGHRP